MSTIPNLIIYFFFKFSKPFFGRSIDIWLEKLFVNYMLQECFPYTDRERDVRYEGVALCGLYAFCLFLLSGCQPEDREKFIDLTATIFRLVGHSAFDHNVIVLIKNQLKK